MSENIKPIRDMSDGAVCCESIGQTVSRFVSEHERVCRVIERQDAELTRLRAELAAKNALLWEARAKIGALLHAWDEGNAKSTLGTLSYWMSEEIEELRSTLARLREGEGGK